MRILAIVGATATGKTDLAESLADRIGGEIVCVDSRQVYRELEIGTGKPDALARAARPHHLFDRLGLGEHASAGWYARVAAETCAAIDARGRVPLLVGGSGLYLGALRRGLSSAPPRDAVIRARLVSEVSSIGVQALHARLARCDPATAARLGTRDAQRITRALEVYEISGRPLSWWHARESGPPLAAAWTTFELTLSAAASSERIARRTRAMFASGLVAETEDLVRRGLRRELERLRAVGYDEALQLLDGGIDREEAERRTDLRTRRLAKRQRTWFRHQVEALRLDAAAADLEARIIDAWNAAFPKRARG